MVAVAFAALTDQEQAEALEKILRGRSQRLAGSRKAEDRFLWSLRRAAQIDPEGDLNTSRYRRAWRELRQRGEEIENLSSVVRHFGSWREAKEALELSNGLSDRQIIDRLAKRRLGKVWRYTADTLRQTLAESVAEVGHIPQVAEFECWRERKLELARAQGDNTLHVPGAGAYRRRFGSWEKALLELGYLPDEVAERLERGTSQASR